MKPPVLSPLAADATRREWRELGFFYDRDDSAKEWRLTGSRDGLKAFAELLSAYSTEPGNAELSAHDHFGPHMYLKVMTSNRPNITENAIEGTLDDLHRLSELVEQALRAGKGSVSIRDEYAPGAAYSITLDIKAWPFDPASLDPQLGPVA